jgi:hypothetical protein
MCGRAMDLSEIRHPRERLVLFLSAVANLAIVAGVAAAILLAPGWLDSHPRAAGVVQRVQGAALAGMLLLPALAFLRVRELHRHGFLELDPGLAPHAGRSAVDSPAGSGP